MKKCLFLPIVIICLFLALFAWAPVSATPSRDTIAGISAPELAIPVVFLSYDLAIGGTDVLRLPSEVGQNPAIFETWIVQATDFIESGTFLYEGVEIAYNLSRSDHIGKM